jgi:hypothetical protein
MEKSFIVSFNKLKIWLRILKKNIFVYNLK